MKKIRNNTLALLVIAAIFSGCATGRLADLRDCGKISIGVGAGLGADVGLGALVHPSVGILAKTYRVGSESRNVYSVWQEGEIYYPVVFFPALFMTDSPWAYSYNRTCMDWSQQSLAEKNEKWLNWSPMRNPGESGFHRATDFEAGVTLGIVAARVGLNPLECLDFLLGFCGLDIANDDKLEKQKATHAPGP
ncbi:MAG: hypothetical protein WCS52_04665 [bacterium]